MPAEWTDFGARINGSTALPRAATRPASGGADTMNTTRRERARWPSGNLVNRETIADPAERLLLGNRRYPCVLQHQRRRFMVHDRPSRVDRLRGRKVLHAG